MPPRLFILLFMLLTVGGLAFAQQPLEQMRDLLERGYYNSAARVIGPALVDNQPNDPEAHFLYSRSLYLTGEIERARTEFERAVELGGDESSAEYNHLGGLLSAAEGDLQTSMSLLRNAFVRSQSYQHAMDWGRVAWQAYRLEEALQAFDAATQTAEGSRRPWPHLNRGRILTFLGRTDEAIEAFQTAIEVFEEYDTGEARPSPAYVEAYYRLGELYESMGERQGEPQLLQLAIDHYRAALTGDPNYAPAIEALDSLSRRLP